ncbi:dysbindin domain-containing protein 1 isoform X2 [Neovison vison]|uniref:dysbindin domain-containing protein 1 isoform X2 n=1 Tax=Neovison vison TaxID=452646 RepID=UPI001CF0549C|nr:dysbindin domain-containing protein 1 isoform X2 [Neogale vison]
MPKRPLQVETEDSIGTPACLFHPWPWPGIPAQTTPRNPGHCPEPPRRVRRAKDSRLPLQPLSPQVTQSVFVAEIVKDVEAPQAALGPLAHGTGDSCHSPTAEEEVGIPIPAPGLLQVTERRQVHFDLLDLTELTDMSDQELAEVFADSDDESLAGESPAGLHPLPRASCLRSPSWTRTRAEQNREKQPLGDPERRPAIADTFLTVERPKED